MGELMVDKLDGTVQVRGIAIPADHIRAAMLETGGIVVANKELNERLDVAVMEHKQRTDKEPEVLIIESEPGIVFIPKKVTLARSPFVAPIKTDIYIYFAARKMF